MLWWSLYITSSNELEVSPIKQDWNSYKIKNEFYKDKDGDRIGRDETFTIIELGFTLIKPNQNGFRIKHHCSGDRSDENYTCFYWNKWFQCWKICGVIGQTQQITQRCCCINSNFTRNKSCWRQKKHRNDRTNPFSTFVQVTSFKRTDGQEELSSRGSDE